MARTRPRVLLLAESCNPESSSVSLEGWSLSRALFDHADTHVVTHVRNRSDILGAGWSEGREFTSLDPATVEGPVTRIGEAVRNVTKLGWTWTTVMTTVWYYYFEHLAWQRFGEAIRKGEFDVVHRLNPVTPPTQSLIARRCHDAGVPFVWGPIMGGLPWPKEFRGAMFREGEWLSYVRTAYKLLPGYRATRRAAAGLIVGSVSVWDQMEDYRDRCVYVPGNAVDPTRFEFPEPPVSDGPLRVSFVGRIVPYKGADMLIDAVAPLARSGRVVVDIIGDGPDMPALKQRIAEAKIEDRVTLHGWIHHKEVARRLAESHVFAFPSIREFGGAVVLEAMALGVVPVVVNYGGPGEHVTDETGFRVPLGPRDEMVVAFRDILGRLADSPERVRQIGKKARERVHRLFTWDVKARQILDVYGWVLGQREKPDFGMPLS